MTTLEENDLEFKPANIVKGQVLCKFMTQDIGDKNQEGMDGKSNQKCTHILFLTFQLLKTHITMT